MPGYLVRDVLFWKGMCNHGHYVYLFDILRVNISNPYVVLFHAGLLKLALKKDSRINVIF